MLPVGHWTGRARGPERTYFGLLSDGFERPEIEIKVATGAPSLDWVE